MTYPSPPWQLQGFGFQTLHLIDSQKARLFIPPELEIVSVFPGKTLGGVYLSKYTAGSMLEYSEAIVVAGLARDRDAIGSWISHIYVDNEDSVTGGREIWGLPKEMAQFRWEDTQVSVWQNDRQLCCLNRPKRWLNLSTWWQQKFSGKVFSKLNSDILLFTSDLTTQIDLVKGNLMIPYNSPCFNLNLGRPWLTLKLNQLNLIANAPYKITSQENEN